MTYIADFVSKIEDEFTARDQALNDRAKELTEIKDALEVSKSEIETKIKELEARESKIKEDETRIVKFDGDVLTSDQVREGIVKAESLKEEANKTLKLANEKMGDVNVALADLAKREEALSLEKASYKEEIKKEFIDKFLAK